MAQKKAPSKQPSSAKKTGSRGKKSSRANAGFEKKKLLLVGGISALVLAVGFTGYAIGQNQQAKAASGAGSSGYPAVGRDAYATFVMCKYPSSSTYIAGAEFYGNYDTTTSFTVSVRSDTGASGSRNGTMGYSGFGAVDILKKSSNISISYKLDIRNNKKKIIKSVNGSRTFSTSNLRACSLG